MGKRVRGRAAILLAVLLVPALAGCLNRIEAPRDLIPNVLYYEPATVRAENGGLTVDGRPFLVKGVNVAPVPPPVDPREDDWQWTEHPEVYLELFRHAKRMGANSIRIAHASGDAESMTKVLNAAARFDLRVIMGHPGPVGENAADPAVRERVRLEMMHLVRSYMNHPAVLMWCVGNDVNQWYPKEADLRHWYSLLEDITRRIHAVDPYHPVATCNNALTDAESLARHAPSIDVYGANMYIVDAGEWHQWFLPEYERIFGNKPLVITEFGADRYDSSRNREDEDTQARILQQNWLSLLGTTGRYAFAGAVVYDLTDAWWKNGDPDVQDGTRDWAPSNAHVLPDGVFSEEWFGLLSWRSDGTLRTTKAYETLQMLWANEFERSPPTIVNIGSETRGASVRISADVVTYGDLPATVVLHYREKGGSWATVPMTRDGSEWSVVLGPFDTVAILFYRIEAVDAAGRSRTAGQETARAVPGVDAGLAILVAAAVAVALARKSGRKP